MKVLFLFPSRSVPCHCRRYNSGGWQAHTSLLKGDKRHAARPRQERQWKYIFIYTVLIILYTSLLAPSGALVFIMVYYIPAATTFPNFSNSSDSKVKVKVKGPNMCYIFEKHWIQGYRI